MADKQDSHARGEAAGFVRGTRGAAEFTGLPESFLERLRREGGGPPYIKAGRRTVLYEVAALREWLAERTFHSTSEYRQGAA